MRKVLALLLAFVAFAATAAPNQAPTISITSPASGTSFTTPATITFTVDARDSDGTVNQVEYFDGTASIGRVPAAPFGLTWTGATAGTHTITAKATDSGGKTTTSAAIQVVVITLSTIVTSPANNAVVQTGFVFVQGTLTGPDTTSVIVTAGGGHSVVASVSGGTFGANVLVGRGANDIEVQVARRDGTSEAVKSRVTGISAPVVALTAPSFTGPYTAPATVTLTAQAASLDANIAQVEFYDGSTRLGSASAPPYSFAATLSGTGNHGIFARAIDQYGFFTDSRSITLATQSQPPTVSITAPAPGTNVRSPGNVTFTATASDPDGTVDRVDYMEGQTVLGGSQTPPYSFTWLNPPVGPHNIIARARDNSGALGYSSPAVQVNVVTNLPPTVNLTAPANNATFRAPATIAFSATASDADGTVQQVDYLLNGVVVATGLPPAFDASKAGVASATYSVVARARDNDGATTDSTPPRTITVAANAPPTVSITSPANNASFNAPTSVAITANAADVDGTVTRVEFFVDGTSIGFSTGPSFSATWASATLGSHTLTAVATDNDGATTPSAPITITVNGITATITAPANNSNYVAPAAYDVLATVSTSSGVITSIEWYDGAAKIATTTVPPPGAATVNGILNLSAVAAGAHVYTVKGFDSGSRTATSPAVTVNVAPAPTPPTVSLDSPKASAFYVAPGLIRITALAAPGSAAISRVELFANSTLLATLTSAPYSFVWNNVAAGTYAIKARATDTTNVSVESATASVTVAPAPTVSAAPGLDGSSVGGDSVVVMGTLQAPTNSAVSVNGARATLTRDGRFFTTVALAPGTNSIPITVMAQDGQASTQTISVSSSAASQFQVDVDPAEGVAPMTATVRIRYSGTPDVGSVEYDFGDDGSVEATVPSASIPVSWQLTGPGLQSVRVTIKNPQGSVLYSTVRWAYAEDPLEKADRVAGVHNDIMDRLSSGDIEHALNLFAPQSVERFRQVFTALGPNLAAAVAQFGRIEHVMFAEDIAQLVVVRSTAQGPEAFMMTLMRGDDGIWRMETM